MKRDPQENARRLYEIASTQGGYFTSAQAREAGYAYSQQHYHLSRGAWLRVDHGLHRLRDYPPGERDDLIRWSLWSRNQQGRPQAVVSHQTALAVYDLGDLLPARIHLTVPAGFRKEAPDGLVLHQAELQPHEVEQHEGYRITTPLRTLLDAAGSPLSQEHLDRALRQALERGLVRRRPLQEAAAASDARERLELALDAALEPGS
ncbi:MAG: type IV toxin-antitoxin system AbiEi family antitoxin domain-containing protein [Chloroflexia bacterium]|nr:type IV toxin-antitoxin system AbiEi family antitoxin domain-containing protein [Chloroflexia bacterium]